MTDQLEFNWENESPPPPARVSRPAEPQAALVASAPQRVSPIPPDENALKRAAAAALHQELIEATGLAILLKITNNRSTMMSVRYAPDGRSARLSLHHMFLRANPVVRHALAQWVRKPKARKSAEVLDAFIREQRDQIASGRARKTRMEPVGRYFNLKTLFDEVNAQYFGNTIDAGITWGKMPRLRRRRSIRFGSFAPEENLVRLHPLLDQDFVPAFFVRYIVFHEMLHAHLGIEESAEGRRSIHTAEFKRLEKKYPDYDLALAWMQETRNLNRLLQAYRAR